MFSLDNYIGGGTVCNLIVYYTDCSTKTPVYCPEIVCYKALTTTKHKMRCTRNGRRYLVDFQRSQLTNVTHGCFLQNTNQSLHIQHGVSLI